MCLVQFYAGTVCSVKNSGKYTDMQCTTPFGVYICQPLDVNSAL